MAEVLRALMFEESGYGYKRSCRVQTSEYRSEAYYLRFEKFRDAEGRTTLERAIDDKGAIELKGEPGLAFRGQIESCLGPTLGLDYRCFSYSEELLALSLKTQEELGISSTRRRWGLN